MSTKKSFVTVIRVLFLCLIFSAGFLGIIGCSHGAIKVAVGPNGPWILTADGAIFEHNGSGWDKKEPSGTADDLAICGTFLTILTRPDSQGDRTLKSRDVYGDTWTTYPSIGSGVATVKQVACYGNEPVVVTEDYGMYVYIYSNSTQSWGTLHHGASEISVMNGRLFHLYPTTTSGNVWSKNVVGGGPYKRWGENLVAHKIAGDANGYPWVATDATSNPLYKWDTTNEKWTFGFSSGPVYDMDIRSYVRMYILSDPQVSGGGYTLYSHELYSGGWTKYSLPKK